MTEDSPLIEGVKRLESKIENVLGDPQKRSGKKIDQNWHAEKVNEANESFKKTPVAKTGESVTPKVSERKGTKKTYHKRVAGKR